jgi:hypothetical protein
MVFRMDAGGPMLTEQILLTHAEHRQKRPIYRDERTLRIQYGASKVGPLDGGLQNLAFHILPFDQRGQNDRNIYRARIFLLLLVPGGSISVLCKRPVQVF